MFRLLKHLLRSPWFHHAIKTVVSIYGLTVGFLVGLALGIIFGPNFTVWLWHGIKSDLAKDLFLSLLAAYAGTSGAQLVAEWNSRRKEKLAELRAANAAIVLAFDVAHSYVLIKKQVVQGIVGQYKNARILFACHEVAILSGSLPKTAVFHYEIQLNTTHPPFSPILQLEKVLLERLSSDEGNVFLLTAIIQSIDGYAKTCAERDEWIARYKALGEDDQVLKAYLLFGLRQPSGRTDDMYPQLLKQLEIQTDDCIGFGQVLVEKLISYALEARAEFRAEFGPGAPKIPTPTFHEAARYLLPDPQYYDVWKKEVYPD